MQIEKEIDNIKWFKEKELRIKVEKLEDASIITVMLGNYNICFKMMVFEFINTISNDTRIDIKAVRNELNQVIFKVNKFDQKTIIKFISNFIVEWNIQTTEATVSQSDLIPDEIWYSEN